MKAVDYNQVARFEAASELLNIFMSICIALKKRDAKYAKELEDMRFETRRLKQKLRTQDDDMVKIIRERYGKIVREYYKNPKDFKLSKSFFDVSV